MSDKDEYIAAMRRHLLGGDDSAEDKPQSFHDLPETQQEDSHNDHLRHLRADACNPDPVRADRGTGGDDVRAVPAGCDGRREGATGMTAPTITLRQLRELGPCEARMAALEDKLPAEGAITAAMAVKAGATLFDLEWLVERLAKEDADVARRARLYAADCAARVLPIYEALYPDDDRPRQVIVTARAYAVGAAGREALIAAGACAWDAARAAAGDAAGDAARATARAAARAATWAAARDVACGAAWAAAWAAAGSAAEREWQFARLLQWLSDDEPDPLPLEPAKEAA